MAYLTARQRPFWRIRMSDRDTYVDHGVPFGQQALFARNGIAATVGSHLKNLPADDVEWLAATFSPKGIRRLTESGLNGQTIPTLRQCAEMNLSRVRGYVSGTDLSVEEISRLMRLEVPSRECIEWVQRHQEAGHQHDARTLAALGTTSVVVRNVPLEHFAGWVRFANRHGLLSPVSTRRWEFLGGSTALMVAAGLSPVEAEALVRSRRDDRATLLMLAHLRSGATRRDATSAATSGASW